MNAVDVIHRLHEHRLWATHNLLAAATAVPEESLKRQFPIGQGSIWKSLLHLYAAEYVWLESLLGDPSALTPGDVVGKLPGNQEGAGAIASLSQLKTQWGALDARWQKLLADLTPEALERPVGRLVATGKMAGQLISTRTLDALLHVCTHCHYTTAQVVNMFRQLDVSPLPDVMLISLARAESAAGR